MLVDGPRVLHNHEVNPMLVGQVLKTVDYCTQTAAPPAHVVDVGLGHSAVRLG